MAARPICLPLFFLAHFDKLPWMLKEQQRIANRYDFHLKGHKKITFTLAIDQTSPMPIFSSLSNDQVDIIASEILRIVA